MFTYPCNAFIPSTSVMSSGLFLLHNCKFSLCVVPNNGWTWQVRCHCPRTCHLWVSVFLGAFRFQVPPSLCPVGEPVTFGVLAGELVLYALEGSVWSVEPVCTLLWVVRSLSVVGSMFVWFSLAYAWAHATDGIVLLPGKVHV